MAIKVIKISVKKSELLAMAKEEFGDIVKAVVDVEQGIMAIGGELHDKNDEEWIEFDSMVNIKPSFGNRSRGVENPEIQKKIKEAVRKLVAD